MSIISTFVTGENAMQRLGGEIVVAKNELNFATTNASSADIIEAIKIPAGAFLMDCFCYINTAEGATMTFDIGDGTDPNGCDDAVDGNATAGTESKMLEADPYGKGKYYSAADTIDIVLDDDADMMVVTIIAVYAMLENVT